MLSRNLSRIPLTVIVVTSAVAFLCTVAAVVYAAVSDNTGFGMADSSAQSCSNYLALKTERNRSLLYSAAFVGSSSAVFFLGSAAALSALLCVTNRSETHAEFPQFTFAKLCGLYLLLSLAAVALVPGVGNHLTLIVEKGVKCTETIEVNSIIFLALFGTALLLTLTAWIFLFLLNIQIKDQAKYSSQKDHIQQTKYQNPHIIEQQPQSMKYYLSSIIMENKIISKTMRQQAKQSLLSQICQQDKVSSDEDAAKIVFQQFQDYKKRQQLIKKKEEQQQNIIQQYLRQKQKLAYQLIRRRQEERIKSLQKKTLKNVILSPDDPDFDQKLLEESSENNPIDALLASKNNQQENAFLIYPSNYIPQNEQDERRYNQFKRNLLKQLGFERQHVIRRHPQNMQGGRSKKMINKYLKEAKKPKRNEEIYLKAIQQQLKMNFSSNQPFHFKQMTVNNQVISSDEDEKANDVKLSKPKIEKKQDLSSPAIIPQQFEQSQQIVKPEKIYFQKQKSLSPIKKQLFDESKSFINSNNKSSILGSLVNGVIQSEPKLRLKRIKESKNQSQKTLTRKKGRIIDQIRYKYQ